jgi:mannosyltransferase OCH1-like enzyme
MKQITHFTNYDLGIVQSLDNITIYRFDEVGWEPFEIMIESEVVKIPRSITSEFSFDYDLSISHSIESQQIPKIIVQTAEWDECSNPFEEIIHKHTKKLNPEYTYRFFNSIQRREFIKTHFDGKVLDAYDCLVPGAFKADLFRYCFLYVNGGCYMDNKLILRKPLRDIIKPDDDFLVCIDYSRENLLDKHRDLTKSYLNSIIISVPNNPNLKRMIDACVENINNPRHFLGDIQVRGCQGILDLTGPTLFYSVLHSTITPNQLRFKHLIENNDETCYKNFQIVEFDGSLVATKTYKNYIDQNHYSELWMRKEVFYKNKVETDKFIMMQYPNQYNDVFHMDIVGENIQVSRHEGWGLNLNVLIIHKKTSKSRLVNIGSSSGKNKSVPHHMFAYVTNECHSIGFYREANRAYDFPIIGALYVNDK